MAQMGIRIGLMVPANNTTMEHELPAWLPAGSSCRRIGIPRGKGMLTLENLPAYIGQAMTLARNFTDDGLDLVAYGCTAADFSQVRRAMPKLRRSLPPSRASRLSPLQAQ